MLAQRPLSQLKAAIAISPNERLLLADSRRLRGQVSKLTPTSENSDSLLLP